MTTDEPDPADEGMIPLHKRGFASAWASLDVTEQPDGNRTVDVHYTWRYDTRLEGVLTPKIEKTPLEYL